MGLGWRLEEEGCLRAKGWGDKRLLKGREGQGRGGVGWWRGLKREVLGMGCNIGSAGAFKCTGMLGRVEVLR